MGSSATPAAAGRGRQRLCEQRQGGTAGCMVRPGFYSDFRPAARERGHSVSGFSVPLGPHSTVYPRGRHRALQCVLETLPGLVPGAFNCPHPDRLWTRGGKFYLAQSTESSAAGQKPDLSSLWLAIPKLALFWNILEFLPTARKQKLEEWCKREKPRFLLTPLEALYSEQFWGLSGLITHF